MLKFEWLASSFSHFRFMFSLVLACLNKSWVFVSFGRTHVQVFLPRIPRKYWNIGIDGTETMKINVSIFRRNQFPMTKDKFANHVASAGRY